MTKTYKVIAHMTTTLVCEIEADSEDKVWEIAKNTEGRNFTALPDALWDIYDIIEVTE